MLIYAGTKSDFMIDTENDRLETKLYENIKLKMNVDQFEDLLTYLLDTAEEHIEENQC